jgi:RNA methyltransferase, TrmH family
VPKEILLSDKSDKLNFFKNLVDDPHFRKSQGYCLIFGKKIIFECSSIEAYLVTSTSKNDKDLEHLDKYVLSDKAFKKLSKLVTPEPYGALVKLKEPKLPVSIKKGVLILDGVSDPGNLGTIFRTAYGLGLDFIFMVRPCCDPYHEKVLRSAKACTLKMPWMYIEKNELEKALSSYGLDIFVAMLEGPKLSDIHNTKPFALILGNESQGVSKEFQLLGSKVHIPQHHLESYNVAVACGILSYTLAQGVSS